MKLATLNNGTRDGGLIVVNRSLTEYVSAPADIPTMQSALDDWANSSNMLLQLFNDLEAGKLQSNKLKIDILYRISFPYRMHEGNANKVFVFGTSEYQKIDNMIYQGEELNEKYINKSIKVITSSNWSKVGFIKGGFKENEVIVIPCGVDLKIFKPINKEKKIKIRKKLNINNDHFVFLNVSAMTWNKGINKLLVAFSEIKRNIINKLFAQCCHTSKSL